MIADLALPELRRYRPAVAEPDGFDAFWAETVADARGRGEAASFVPAGSPLRSATAYDVTFAGCHGDPVRAWLLVPDAIEPGNALVVEYVGYNGGRGDPLDWLHWIGVGHPHLIMDSRGQGGGWRRADTADPSDDGAPSSNGFLTRGIADPRTYYYTRLFVDAVRAVDAAREHPVGRDRPIVTAGASQGGALAIAAAHLAGGVAAVLPDVPFLAHPARAVQLTDTRPYHELVEYCSVDPARAERAFATLSYLDAVNHAKRTDAAALFSVALLDEIAPASTVFAAFNHYRGADKDIAVYRFCGHEGGGSAHRHAQLDFLAARHLRG